MNQLYPLHRLLPLLALLAICEGGTLTAENRRPNILVIVADDMGFADVGFNGCQDIPTPHIDSLAKNGVVCTNGYVSGCVCSPTRSGLMTGRYQQRFGNELNPQGPPSAKNIDQGLALSETTMPQRLKTAGYVTGMVGKWHLGHRHDLVPNSRGFDEFFGFLGGQHGYRPVPDEKGATAIHRNGEVVKEEEYLTTAFGREAAAFITKSRQKPWFLYLPFNSVHTPLHATAAKLEQFAEIDDAMRRTYAAMQSSMDDAIGVVLETLRSTGQEDDTLIFFFSDNGGPLGVNGSRNGNLRGKKGETWEGGIHVPFVVQWKSKLPAGQKCMHPVIQLDVLPTALAAAGIEISSDWKLDGVNLLPALTSTEAAPPHDALYWRNQSRFAIRDGDWKLVKSGKVAGKATVADAELYNLREDPSESRNLAATEPEKVRLLAEKWESWNKTLIAPRWGNATEPDGTDQQSKPRKKKKQI